MKNQFYDNAAEHYNINILVLEFGWREVGVSTLTSLSLNFLENLYFRATQRHQTNISYWKIRAIRTFFSSTYFI